MALTDQLGTSDSYLGNVSYALGVTTSLSARVTQLVALLLISRAFVAPPVEDPVGDGEIDPGTDPAAGLNMCAADTPVAYLEVTPPGGSTKRYTKIPINRTVSDEPRVRRFGPIVRSLTSRQSDLRGSIMTPELIDTDRALRALESTDSLVNARVEAYLTTLAGLNAGSTARRVFSGLVTDSEPLADLAFRLRAVGYLQTLLELSPAPTYPQRLFSVDDFPNLANDPSGEANPGNPALIGKPVPIGYGILSDESLGADARGVVPAWFTGKRQVDGFDWDEYVLFGHAPSPGGILGFFGDIDGIRQRFTTDYEGVDFLWPGHTGWNAALGSSNLYRDFNSHRYTVFYARGPRSDSARTGRIPFSVNIGGVEAEGDGTGDTITSIARQALHLLNNFVLQNYGSGAWLSIPTVNGYSRLKTSSFETVRTVSSERMGGSPSEGHVGAFLLGWDGSTTVLRELVKLFHDCGIDFGENKDGQIVASMVDPDAASVRSISDVTDVIAKSFHARRRRDEIRNTVTYRYARRYVPALPEPTPAEGDALPGTLRKSQIAWETDNVAPTPDASSVTKYGTRKLDLSFELVRDEATAEDLAAMKQEVLAPGPTAVGYKDNLCGTNVDLGDNIDLTHFQGISSTGYTARNLRCEIHGLNLDSMETEIEGLDVENL